MTLFILYSFIVLELLFISFYFFMMKRLKHRRFSDRAFFALSLFFAISYGLYSLQFLGITTTILQIIIDVLIMIHLAIFFIKQMLMNISNKDSKDNKNDNHKI